MKRFARWVSITGKCNHPKWGQTFALVQVARKNGMRVICGYKPGMHCWHEIGLAGTADAMRRTEAAWRAKGHEVKAKQPPAAFGFNLDVPEERWVDREMDRRLKHGCYGGACPECDQQVKAGV